MRSKCSKLERVCREYVRKWIYKSLRYVPSSITRSGSNQILKRAHTHTVRIGIGTRDHVFLDTERYTSMFRNGTYERYVGRYSQETGQRFDRQASKAYLGLIRTCSHTHAHTHTHTHTSHHSNNTLKQRRHRYASVKTSVSLTTIRT